MNKKNLLLLVFLLSSYAHAAISLEANVAYSSGQSQRNINSCIKLDNTNDPVTLQCQEFKIDLRVVENSDAGLTIESSLFEGDELISQPTMHCAWGQKATVRLGEKNSNDQELNKELIFEIIPTVITE